MPRPIHFWFALTTLLFSACSKPYSESAERSLPGGHTYRVIKVNKENYLPIYYQHEIQNGFKYKVVKEITQFHVVDQGKPAPTKESLNGGLSYEAYKNNANAIILISIGDGEIKPNSNSVSYKIVSKLIVIQN